MTIRPFVSVIPKAVKVWAGIAMVCVALFGMVAGYFVADPGTFGMRVAFGAAAVFTGAMVGLLLLGLGFVYADAQRRGMRAALWVCVALFFPHLLGFLLYFVMRQPMATTCIHCGRTIERHPQFCPWCGYRQAAGDAGTMIPTAG